MSKKKANQFPDAFYNRPVTSALIIEHMFDPKVRVYNRWKKLLKEGTINDTMDKNELKAAIIKMLKDDGIEKKLIGNVHIVACNTQLGPVFRLAVGGHVLPLAEDGFEAGFIIHSEVEEVL
jgi:hypothetical protein